MWKLNLYPRRVPSSYLCPCYFKYLKSNTLSQEIIHDTTCKNLVVKACSHNAIATAIFTSQLMSCMRFKARSHGAILHACDALVCACDLLFLFTWCDSFCLPSIISQHGVHLESHIAQNGCETHLYVMSHTPLHHMQAESHHMRVLKATVQRR